MSHAGPWGWSFIKAPDASCPVAVWLFLDLLVSSPRLLLDVVLGREGKDQACLISPHTQNEADTRNDVFYLCANRRYMSLVSAEWLTRTFVSKGFWSRETKVIMESLRKRCLESKDLQKLFKDKARKEHFPYCLQTRVAVGWHRSANGWIILNR